MSLKYILSDYDLNAKQWVQSVFVSEIGLRHAKKALNEKKQWRGHTVIAIILLVPGLGLLGSLIEKVIAACHKYFHQRKIITNTQHSITNMPIGFPNLGHSCFMNSALQGIFASKHISKILERPLKPRMLPIITRGVDGENELTEVQESQKCFEARKKLQHELQKLYHAYTSRNHSEISSILPKIVETINEAELYISSNEWERGTKDQYTFDPVREGNDSDSFAFKLLSALDYPYDLVAYDTEIEEIICKKDKILVTEKIKNSNSYLFKFKLERFYETSKLQQDLPPIVMLRMLSGGNKNFPIPSDSVFDFSKSLPDEVLQGKKALYKLVSRNTKVPGHSFAYILHQNQWYRADDAQVKQVESNEVVLHKTGESEVLILDLCE